MNTIPYLFPIASPEKKLVKGESDSIVYSSHSILNRKKVLL
jgi:hypothetical protein